MLEILADVQDDCCKCTSKFQSHGNRASVGIAKLYYVENDYKIVLEV